MPQFQTVDTSERLPEKSGQYFVYIQYYPAKNPIMTVMDFTRIEDGQGEWSIGTTVYNDMTVLSWLEPIDQLEVDHMQQWVNDLQSGMYINCVYCGHRYGPSENTPATMADVLKEHIKQCPKHPMSELKRRFESAMKNMDQLLKKELSWLSEKKQTLSIKEIV